VSKTVVIQQVRVHAVALFFLRCTNSWIIRTLSGIAAAVTQQPYWFRKLYRTESL